MAEFVGSITARETGFSGIFASVIFTSVGAPVLVDQTWPVLVPTSRTLSSVGAMPIAEIGLFTGGTDGTPGTRISPGVTPAGSSTWLIAIMWSPWSIDS